jgi:hypothetical protein
MDLRNTQLKDTYGNLVTTGTTAGSPTTGGLQNGQGTLLTSVGIGTDSPSTELHVTSAGGYAELRLQGASGNGGSVEFFNSTTKLGDIFINTSNDIIFRNTSEAMRIDSSGNVGIGISPSKKLTVFGTGSGNATVQIEGEGGADPYINFLANNTQHWSLGVDDSDSDKFKLSEHSALGTNDYLVVDTSGKVGIGTDSPSKMLDLSANNTGGASASNVLRFTDIDSTASSDQESGSIEFYTSDSSNPGVGSAIKGLSGANGTASANLLFEVSGSERMRIDSSGDIKFAGANSNTTVLSLNTDSGSDTKQLTLAGGGADSDGRGARFRLYGNNHASLAGDADLSTGNVSGAQMDIRAKDKITLHTNSNPSVTIDSSGNVGIGTDSPNSNLSVLKNQTSDTAIEVSNVGSVSATTTASFLLSETPGTPKGWFRRYRDGTARTSIGYDGSFIIESTAGTERMRIDSSGNVGIGTDAPSSKLDIQQGTAGNIISAEFDNTDYTANNRNAIKIRQATSAGSSFSTFLGTDKDTGNVFLSNDSITADHFVINTSGQVGIGTTSPDEKLEVYQGNIKLGTDTNTTSKLIFERTAAIRAELYVGSSNQLQFDLAGSERMRIGSTGDISFRDGSASEAFYWDADVARLGIGETSPSTKLHLYEAGSTSIYSRIQNGNNSLYLGLESGGIAQVSSDLSSLKILANTYTSFETAGSERMRILSGGDVSFAMQDFSSSPSNTVYGLRLVTGTTGKSYWKSAVNADTTHYHYEFLNTNGSVGNISTSASATAYNTSSDYRLKENVVPMEGALDKVAQLKPSTFNFIADADTTVDGFLAHEVADVVPNAVSGEKDAVDEEGNPMYQGIDHSKLVPILVGAIQELKAEIEQLKNQ